MGKPYVPPCGARLNSVAESHRCRRTPSPGSSRCWQHGGKRRPRTWRNLKKGDPVYLPPDPEQGLEEVVGTFDCRGNGTTVYVWLTAERDITEIPDVDLDEVVAERKP